MTFWRKEATNTNSETSEKILYPSKVIKYQCNLTGFETLHYILSLECRLFNLKPLM